MTPKWDAVPDPLPKAGWHTQQGCGPTQQWHLASGGWGGLGVICRWASPKPHQTISVLDATRCSSPVPGRTGSEEGQSESGCWRARQAPSIMVGVEIEKLGKLAAGDLRKSRPGAGVTWPGHRTVSGRRTPRTSVKAFRVSVESSLILVPITQTSSDPLGLGGGMRLGEGARRRGRCGKRPPS